MDEENFPTRAEIMDQLESVRNFPANNGLDKAAMRLKQRERLTTFLQGRGLTQRQIRAVSSDIDSYYPGDYVESGRQV